MYVQLKADRTNVVSKRFSVPLTAGSTDEYMFSTVRVELEQFGGGEWNQVRVRHPVRSVYLLPDASVEIGRRDSH
jgi:hypothetical protein